MARSRTLVLNTKVDVTGADKLRGLGRTLQQTGGLLTAGLTLPILGIGASMLTAAEDAAKAQAKLKNVFDSMGAAAFTSIEALNQHAAALQEATTFDDEAINEAQAVLLTFGNITGDAFTRATEAALDMTALFDGDLQSAIVQVGKALNDPIKGVTALTRVGVSFTEQQLDQIKVLQQSGDVLGAQTIILQELERQFGGTAEALAETAGGQMTQAFNQLGEASEEFGRILAPVLIEVAQGVKDFAKFLRDLNPETRETVVRVAALAAALGPVLIAFGTVLRILSPLGTGLVLLGGKLKVLATALGVSRLALLGWIGAIVGVGVAIGDAARTDIQRLARDVLGDLGTEAGKSAAEISAATEEIAAALGTDIPEAERLMIEAIQDAEGDWDKAIGAMRLSALELSDTFRESVADSGRQWQTYQDQISGAMFDEPDGAVPTIGRGVDAMADEMGDAPGRMADELLAAQRELADPIRQLVDFMDEALSPVQERFRLQGFLASTELAEGLTSANPLIRQKADEMQQAALDRLAAIRASFFTSGSSAGFSFGAGLVDPAVTNYVASSARKLALAARGVFPDSEPKDPRSPLRGITTGFGFGDIFAKGLLTGEGAVQGAMRSLVGGGLGALPSLSTGSAAGTHVTNIYLQWDGEPPKGRDEAEIIANLQRLSPLVGGAVVG